MLSPQASLSVGRAVVDDATAYCTGLYMEMLRNSLDLTVTYRAEGHGSRDGWHTYARSVETHGRPALSLTRQGKRPLPWAALARHAGHAGLTGLTGLTGHTGLADHTGRTGRTGRPARTKVAANWPRQAAPTCRSGHGLAKGMQ